MSLNSSAAVFKNCEALNQRGIALAQQGRLDEAAAAFHECLRHDPDFVGGHCNLGLIYTFKGRFAEAVASLEKAVGMRPGDPLLLSNLSNALREIGELDRAVAAARQALAARPNLEGAHNNLGSALLIQGKFSEACASFVKAVQLNPASPEAHSNLCDAYRLQCSFTDAVVHGREAVRLRPDFAQAYVNLGRAHLCNNELDEADACLQRAIQLKPSVADELRLSLADLRVRQGMLSESEALCRQQLEHRPEQPEAHNGIAVILQRQGRLEEAKSHLEHALRLKSDFADAHAHLGMILLLQGDFVRGLPEYEWRWRCLLIPPLPGTAWDGSPPAGRTVVLHTEQGMGDTLQFIRYAALLQRSGAKVFLACKPELVPLMKTSGLVDGFLRPGESPPGALHASLMSLPLLFKTTVDTIPAEIPYLVADPARVDYWRTEMAGLTGKKVGVCWQGNRSHPEDRKRSFPLARFEGLARVPGIHLVSLQVGNGSEQVSALAGRFEILDLSARLNRPEALFVETAALLRNLDLVVTCDTAVAHLAGALGTPTWVALPFAPDWRWQLERTDTPWYPSMRLFRQRRPADWDGVFEEMVGELQRLSQS